VYAVADELGEESVDGEEGGEDGLCEIGSGRLYLVPHFMVYHDDYDDAGGGL
jgi:hypothetical protein